MQPKEPYYTDPVWKKQAKQCKSQLAARTGKVFEIFFGIGWVLAIIGIVATGILVWKILQIQEANRILKDES